MVQAKFDIRGRQGCITAPEVGTWCWADRNLSSRADAILSYLLIFILGIKYV